MKALVETHTGHDDSTYHIVEVEDSKIQERLERTTMLQYGVISDLVKKSFPKTLNKPLYIIYLGDADELKNFLNDNIRNNPS